MSKANLTFKLLTVWPELQAYGYGNNLLYAGKIISAAPDGDFILISNNKSGSGWVRVDLDKPTINGVQPTIGDMFVHKFSPSNMSDISAIEILSPSKWESVYEHKCTHINRYISGYTPDVRAYAPGDLVMAPYPNPSGNLAMFISIVRSVTHSRDNKYLTVSPLVLGVVNWDIALDVTSADAAPIIMYGKVLDAFGFYQLQPTTMSGSHLGDNASNFGMPVMNVTGKINGSEKQIQILAANSMHNASGFMFSRDTLGVTASSVRHMCRYVHEFQRAYTEITGKYITDSEKVISSIGKA